MVAALIPNWEVNFEGIIVPLLKDTSVSLLESESAVVVGGEWGRLYWMLWFASEFESLSQRAAGGQ